MDLDSEGIGGILEIQRHWVRDMAFLCFGAFHL